MQFQCIPNGSIVWPMSSAVALQHLRRSYGSLWIAMDGAACSTLADYRSYWLRKLAKFNSIYQNQKRIPKINKASEGRSALSCYSCLSHYSCFSHYLYSHSYSNLKWQVEGISLVRLAKCMKNEIKMRYWCPKVMPGGCRSIDDAPESSYNVLKELC